MGYIVKMFTGPFKANEELIKEEDAKVAEIQIYSNLPYQQVKVNNLLLATDNTGFLGYKDSHIYSVKFLYSETISTTVIFITE
jgi:hypothetical protein